MALSYFVRLLGRLIKWVIYVGLALTVVVAVVGFFVIRALILPDADKFGNVDDEAKLAGMTVDDMPGADEAYFQDMDHGLLKKPANGAPYPDEILQVANDLGMDPEEVRTRAIKGQNMWIVWTGGNDKFWDFAALNTIGAFDLLKLISNDPNAAYGRHNRFRYNGMINEPCFEKSEEPDPDRFGLMLDRRIEGCGGGDYTADPFADDQKYKGAAYGSRGDTIEVGSYYGEPSGVIGLRLLPNPDFDDAAAKRWDAEKYYNDPDYYNDADLVRPYRVGMSCAFCHVGPNPLNPPENVEEPKFSELTSNPGAQYYWVDRIFVWDTEPRPDPSTPAKQERNFLYQLFHTNPMGTLDTSLVSTDYMNNPRTMNAVYETRSRFMQSLQTGWETLEGGERDNKQFNDYPAFAALNAAYDPETGASASMRVLKDGADSVGALGALNRVYLNIGLFSEEWLLHFRPFAGGQKISPIKIADAQKNSVYWQATEAQSIDMAVFFLVTTRADKLEDARGGEEILAADDSATVERGMEVFAETCAACHSDGEHQPPIPDSYGVDMGICEGGGAGPNYLECWARYWQWAQSDEFKSAMTDKVKDPDFLQGNYLSTERRVPMDLLGVNACSPTATNALKGDIWDNFSSTTYKELPPVGPVTVEHPVSGGDSTWQALGNGRGYLRPASLVSLWTSAPYMLNNSVGYEKHYYGPDYYAAVDPAQAATDDYASDGDATETAATEGDEGAAQEPAAPSYDYASYEDRYSSGYAYPAHVSCPSAYPDDPYMPCVENRVVNFERSIRKMLNPETRYKDQLTQAPVAGQIYRTSAPACLIVPPGFSPPIVQGWKGLLHRIAPWAVTEEGGIEVGPFPADFPINALLNTKLLPDNDEDVSLLSHGWQLAKAGPTLISAVKQLGGQCSPEEVADPSVQALAQEVVTDTGLVDTLVGLSKCPDYVVNKGHHFGSDLSDADKDALISYLKRF
ncbi:hypothetical protein AIOL_003798 [Candidatus Rhodobacter oscarellae]|uniref:Cytochrome c domain-containing protein n=1 Tax=Candidatus Rhodobacter oscarellae TaxID=1675527 RepID=A0A0J9GZB4_9RHOB|nr:cytochrome c [Candidatus Rhodobacter lobularis]KMW58818.1 hypothetical protein AIOL_003798 [Candidatus Rhodobacter lobularis]